MVHFNQCLYMMYTSHDEDVAAAAAADDDDDGYIGGGEPVNGQCALQFKR